MWSLLLSLLWMELCGILIYCWALRGDLSGFWIKKFETLSFWSDDAASLPDGSAFLTRRWSSKLWTQFRMYFWAGGASAYPVWKSRCVYGKEPLWWYQLTHFTWQKTAENVRVLRNSSYPVLQTDFSFHTHRINFVKCRIAEEYTNIFQNILLFSVPETLCQDFFGRPVDLRHIMRSKRGECFYGCFPCFEKVATA